MIPISVGVSGSLSAEQSPNQSVDKVGVPMSSVYRERESDDNLINSAWESPINGPVVHESVEIAQDKGIVPNTEDTFSDWLRSYSKSGPAEAAVDSASLFESDSAPFGLGCDDYDVIPQQPHEPISLDGVSVLTGPCRSIPPPLPVTPNISVHEIVPTISYSRSPPRATMSFYQPADDLGSPATQFVHEVEFDDIIAIPTSESLAKVFANDVEKHTLGTWPFSPPEFDTGEDSKESYSAVHSNPVRAELDSDDECEVLAARASSRDPQPSLLLESLSASSVSATSLSVSPSSLSISSSSVFVPSVPSSLSLAPSVSLSSFPSSLCFPSDPLATDKVPVSRSVSIIFPFMTTSDSLFLSSSSAEVCAGASVVHVDHFDVVQPTPILRPPEDPPPNISDQLRSWLHAYTVLSIEERSLSTRSNPSPLPSTFDDVLDCSTPTDDELSLSLATQATTTGPAIPSASGPLPMSSNSGKFSGFLAPTNEFEGDALSLSDAVGNSPFCSHDLCSTFPASCDNDGRGFHTGDKGPNTHWVHGENIEIAVNI